MDSSGGNNSILDKQKFFQTTKKLTHLKHPADRVTSVIIPLAFVGVTGYMMGHGLWNMMHGKGKIE